MGGKREDCGDADSRRLPAGRPPSKWNGPLAMFWHGHGGSAPSPPVLVGVPAVSGRPLHSMEFPLRLLSPPYSVDLFRCSRRHSRAARDGSVQRAARQWSVSPLCAMAARVRRRTGVVEVAELGKLPSSVLTLLLLFPSLHLPSVQEGTAGWGEVRARAREPRCLFFLVEQRRGDE